jgi:uncharacterized SAM-binding protein YcdF (DUF218 family)
VVDYLLEPLFWLFIWGLWVFKKANQLGASALKLHGSLWLVVAYLSSCPFLLQQAKIQSEYQYLPLELEKLDARKRYTVVVLGAGVGHDKQLQARHSLSSSERLRLKEGLYWARKLPNSMLWVSGPRPKPGYPAQGEVALQAALDAGISPDRVSGLITGTNTWGELEAYAAWSKTKPDGPFVLVTSALHMPRAVQLAKKLGLDPLPAPSNYTSFRDQHVVWDAFLPTPRVWTEWSALAHEWIGALRASTYPAPQSRRIYFTKAN